MAEEPKELYDIISLDGLSYKASTYRKEELEILQPRLEALGYTNIMWSMGESDSFGPLVRRVTMKTQEGEVIHAFYG